uniref:DPPIV_N domain-containing protein n=1 Tax=Macrostomum lignano TaxID=282301 RepID=A0A1I8I6V2_9PLAT
MDWSRQLRKLTYQWLSCGGKDLLLYQNASDGNLYQLRTAQLSASGNLSAWLPEIFLPKWKFSEGRIDAFTASPDCQTLLVPTKVEKPAEAVLCPELSCYSASNPAKLQLAVWGPASSFIAFVYQNNIYYAEDPFNMAPVRITDNRGDPAIANGIASWVYEEEILETSTALWVSPGNQRIAYLRFNDSRTGRYEMQWFGSPEAAYPQRRSVYYPKAGSVGAPISNVTVHVFDVKTTRTAQLARPGPVPEEHYIGAVRWLDADRLLLAWLDRSQTEGCLTVCRLPEATCSLIYNEHRPTGWVELMKQTNSQPLVDPTGNRIFIVLHNSGFRRLAHLRTDSFKVLQWITPAAYDVSDIVHFDPSRRHLYFLSCREQTDSCDATKMHVHRIPVPSSDQQSPVANCMTCEPLLHPFNVTCDYSLASFSHSGEHFLHECLGPEPFQYFLRHNDYSSGYPVQATLERNDLLKQRLSTRRIPRPVFKRLLLRNRTTDKERADPLEVNAKLLVPAQLNESHITKYPLLLKV